LLDIVPAENEVQPQSLQMPVSLEQPPPPPPPPQLGQGSQGDFCGTGTEYSGKSGSHSDDELELALEELL
jgi:hypothetical protein